MVNPFSTVDVMQLVGHVLVLLLDEQHKQSTKLMAL
jgi:hypothetical protein